MKVHVKLALVTSLLLVGCDSPKPIGTPPPMSKMTSSPGMPGSEKGEAAPAGGAAEPAKEEAKEPAKEAAPAGDAPKADAPKSDAPKADEPKADAPKADAPKADAPKEEEKK